MQLAELTTSISRGPTGGFRGGMTGTLNGTYLPAAAGYTTGASSNTNPDIGRVFGANDPRVAQSTFRSFLESTTG